MMAGEMIGAFVHGGKVKKAGREARAE